MDKLIFTIPRPPKKKNSNAVVRITPDAWNKVEEISARTGLSNSYIASRMIEFAAEKTEIVTAFDEQEE